MARFTALKHTKRQIASAFEVDTGTLMAEFVDAQEECLRSPEHQAAMTDYRARQAARKRQKEPQAGN